MPIKRKQKLYIPHFSNGGTDKQSFFKKYANKLTRIKFLTKQMYNQDELNK